MADSNLMKEFFIQLGFKVNEASHANFVQRMGTAEKATIALGASVIGTAVASEVLIDRMAASMERLYFSSKRTGSTVSDIQDYSLSISKLGGTVDGARQSLENFSLWRKTHPGSDSFLEQTLGVKPEHIKSDAQALEDVLNHLGELQRHGGIDQAMALNLGQQVGIDTNTLQAARNGIVGGHEFSDMYKMIGISADDAAEKAHKFNDNLREIGAEAEVFKVGIFENLVGPFDAFNEKVISVGKGLLDLTSDFRHWQDMAAGDEKGKKLVDTIANTASSVWEGLQNFGHKLAIGNEAISIGGGDALVRHGIPAWVAKGFGFNPGGLLGAGDQTDYRGPKFNESRGNQAMAYFTTHGLDPSSSAGIVGNLSNESAGFDPSADSIDPKTGTHHRGIAQWDPARWAELMHQSGSKTPNFEQQLAFIVSELATGSDAGAGRAGRKMSSGKTPHENALIFNEDYERSGVGVLGERMRGTAATMAYDNFKIEQHNTITVTAPDPRAAGKAVQEHLLDNHQQIADTIRNNQAVQ